MLTPDQLNTIDQHIRSHLQKTKWFRQEEFISEITDHYADSILAHMNKGITFNVALINIYDSFGQDEGLKRLDANYWKLSSRALRRKLPLQMLMYFSFPRLFISLPLIAGLLFIKTQSIIPFYIAFPFLLFGYSIFSILSWFFRKRSRYFGALQPFIQRIANPFHRVSHWAMFTFNVEMFSSPLFIGKASPYVATFLYTAGVLFYLAVRDLTRAHLSIKYQKNTQ